MSELEETWRRTSDNQLLEATQSIGEYTEEGRRVIQEEILRRGIATITVAKQDLVAGESALDTLASRGDRLLGQILDSLVAIAPMIASIFLFGISDQLGRTTFFACLAFSAFYILFADGFRNGQSYGKRIVKTAVVDSATGTPCSFKQSFIRNFLLSVLGVFDWVFIFGKRRQRLGDKAARTLVIYKLHR
jgi:uncharacterized RDD family membrane protein YckC